MINLILAFQENRKTLVPWVKEVHRDLGKCKIQDEDIEDRDMFRKKISVLTDLSAEKPTRIKRVFLEEERVTASQRMKEYWHKRKLMTIKKIV